MMRDKVTAEITRLNDVFRRRGIFYEDETALLSAYTNVIQWIDDDARETAAIEIAANEAAQVEAEEKRLNDPNYRTRDLFKNVKITIPRKER